MIAEKDLKDLASAANVVKRIAGQLNRKSSRCKECHLIQYDNWTEYQANKELLATAKKIENWMLELQKDLLAKASPSRTA